MRTPVILVLVHCVAFLLLLAGRLAPGAAGNLLVAIGLSVEFPGCRIGYALFEPTGSVLAFAFVFNAVLYGAGGILIDKVTKSRPAQNF